MNRDQFFARAQSQRKEVEIAPDFKVQIRKLSAAEVESCKRDYGKPEKALEGYRYIVSRVVINDAGERLFTDADKSQLLDLDYDVVETVALAALKFSGVLKDDPKAVAGSPETPA